MPSRRNGLSQQQEEELRVVFRKWSAIAMATGPTDRQEARAAISDAYRVASIAPPERWVFLGSPLHGVLAATMLAGDYAPKPEGVPDSVVHAVEENRPAGQAIQRKVRQDVRKRAWRAITAETGLDVRACVRAGTSFPSWLPGPLTHLGRRYLELDDDHRDEIADSYCKNTREAVTSALWEDLKERVYSLMEARDAKRSFLPWSTLQRMLSLYGDGAASYGSLNSQWLAFYDFFWQCGIRQAGLLKPLARTAAVCGWWWPFERLCIVTDRPSVLTLDRGGRLHNALGPALDYNGEWELWAWHGGRASKKFIEMSGEVRAILDQRNAEVRRAMLQRVGMERFFREVDAEIRDQDVDGRGRRRRLLSFMLSEDDPEYVDPDATIVVVHVIDPSTDREYFLRVPPNTFTCQEAVAWTFGFRCRPKRYKPKVET